MVQYSEIDMPDGRYVMRCDHCKRVEESGGRASFSVLIVNKVPHFYASGYPNGGDEWWPFKVTAEQLQTCDKCGQHRRWVRND